MNEIILIDIEDLDLKSSAVILSIGAVHFHLDKPEPLNAIIRDFLASPQQYHSECVYYPVDAREQLLLGRTTDSEVTAWWKTQPEAKDALLVPHGLYSIVEALNGLLLFRQRYPKAMVFFRGLNHDVPILEHAYKMMGITCPWKYHQPRDVRTLIDVLAKSDRGKLDNYQPEADLIAHHALHDSFSDAQQMCQAYQIAKGEYDAHHSPQ